MKRILTRTVLPVLGAVLLLIPLGAPVHAQVPDELVPLPTQPVVDPSLLPFPLPPLLEELIELIGSIFEPTPESEPPPGDPSPPPPDPNPGSTEETAQDPVTGPPALTPPPATTPVAGALEPPIAPTLVVSTENPAVGEARQRASLILELDGIEPALVVRDFVARRGPRSTVDLFEILTRAGVSPDKIAKIVAPFPVAGRASYTDDWAAPRYKPEFHFHEGTDIFAERGTPVIASSDGVITSMVSDTHTAGNGIRLTAADGSYYYYSHLDQFALGLSQGDRVGSGDVIGFVGATGNAEGGLPHLHFEIHPNGGAAVPPVPYLDRWLEEALATAKALAAPKSLGQRVQTSVAHFVTRTNSLVAGVLTKPRLAGVSVGDTLAWPPILAVAAFMLIRWHRRSKESPLRRLLQA
jgi:murein DD-endopeptidase MepM/ murein hydrolase activator NlpD